VYYLAGPDTYTQAEFRNLCSSLLTTAAEIALQQAGKDDRSIFVGWEDIVRELIPLLATRGFRAFRPKSAGFAGPDIIDNDNEGYYDERNIDKNILTNIINHNLEEERRWTEEHKNAELQHTHGDSSPVSDNLAATR